MARVRTKEGEDLSHAAVSAVIAKLESDNPITKKDACNMLRISYNTTRLGRIIEEFKEKEEFSKLRRKQLKGTPLSESEVVYIIQSYLTGDPISAISDASYRPISTIKHTLAEYNIPLRQVNHSYANPVFLQDQAIREEYNKGDLVYSAKYDCPAYIDGLVDKSDTYGNVYRLWAIGDNSQWIMQPYYELADLTKIQKLGIVIEELSSEDIKYLVNQGLLNARKAKKNDK